MPFVNKPQMQDEHGENTIRRYIHQPITIEHFGIHAAIKENGKVMITKVGKVVGEEVEYDEIEIPASLVFKLASLLKATRKIEYIPVGSASPREEEKA